MTTPAQLCSRFRNLGFAASLTAALWLGPAEVRAANTAVPDGYQLSLLIYATLTALDQANTTGNYTVLRSLAAPEFQRLNPPATLASVFAKYRERHVGLAPIMLFQPKLLEEPTIDGDGLLHLKGFFPTQPLRIGFELAFQLVGGSWRLMTLSVAPSQA